jgi:chemotaxis protein CheD
MRLITKPRAAATLLRVGGKSSDIVTLAAKAPNEIYLHPGQCYAGSEPALISMILGSCVGVCLYDRVRSAGGATHFMLPKWEGTGEPSPRYGDVAIPSLIHEFEQRGCKPHELQAMMFGGAHILRTFQREDGNGIGERNIAAALEILAHYRIFILTKNVGGEQGRKITMRTDVGTVTVRMIGNS